MNDHIEAPTPDIPLLRKAVEWVEWQATVPEQHREWDQEVWIIDAKAAGRDCGTCYCVAGKVCHDAGLDVRALAGQHFGKVADVVADVAQDLLGLTLGERYNLFQSGNDATDVRRVAESIAARVGERL